MAVNDEIKKAVYGAQTYGKGRFGTSLVDQWRNASAGIGALEGLQDKYGDTDEYQNWMSALKADRNDAISSGALSVASGLGNLTASAISTSKVKDSPFVAKLQHMNNLAYMPYTNNASLAQGFSNMEQLAVNPTMADYSTLGGRGITGKKLAAVGSMTAAGAAFGTQIAPGLGTAIGAGVGTLAGALGVANHDAGARAMSRRDWVRNAVIKDAGQDNYYGQAQRLHDTQADLGIVHHNSCGGHISRRRGEGGLIVTFRRNKK